MKGKPMENAYKEVCKDSIRIANQSCSKWRALAKEKGIEGSVGYDANFSQTGNNSQVS